MNADISETLIKNEKYININPNLKEFIIKYTDFWKLLPEKTKDIITTIEEFGNLEYFQTMQFNSTVPEFVLDWYSCYLYIGKSKQYTYYYKCDRKIDKNNYIFKISEGELILQQEETFKRDEYLYE